MARNKKSADEKLKELDQKINRMKMEKQKIQNEVRLEAKKKRDHAMITVGATVLAIYESEKERIYNAPDDEIVSWVYSLFPGYKSEAPDTSHDEIHQMNIYNHPYEEYKNEVPDTAQGAAYSQQWPR